MLLIRRFEEKVDELFRNGVIGGTTHLSVGQEACAVGTADGLRSQDLVVSTHRGHGHLLAKGGDPCRLMAELFGKSDGFSRGIGGSQHMADIANGFMGSNGITGGGIPIAAGIALAEKMKGSDIVTVCFFGDGAVNQGTFHESLNFASVKNLPVVFFCENNQYAMSTPFASMSPVDRVSERASAYGLEGISIDGNDYFTVRKAVEESAGKARSGNPVLIEGLTYRHLGHSKSDGREYRTRDEEKQWEAKDPISRYRAHLIENGITAEEIKEVETEVDKKIDKAVRFAEESPFPA